MSVDFDRLLLVDGNKRPQRVLVELVDGVEHKRCTGCQDLVPMEGFHRSPMGVGGRQSRCKVCTNRARREFRARHPERHQTLDKAYYEANKDKHKDYFLRKTYGITLEQRDRMVAEQEGRCALCGRLPRGTGNSAVLHVDHDHLTGVTRRMLCQDCNNGLGRFLDDPDLLRKAAAYIEAFR